MVHRYIIVVVDSDSNIENFLVSCAWNTTIIYFFMKNSITKNPSILNTLMRKYSRPIILSNLTILGLSHVLIEFDI